MNRKCAAAEGWVYGGPGLRDAVLPPLRVRRALLRAASQEPLLRRYRAWVVLVRMRLWVLLWAVVVLLWIPLDLTLIGGSLGWHLALGRVAMAALFAGAAWACRCKPTQRNIRKAYALLFGIPLVFFIATAPYLKSTEVALSLAGQAYLHTYQLFPLLIAGSIGLLPVTLLEGAGLVVACVLASVASVVYAMWVTGHAILPVASEFGWLWTLFIAGSAGTLAGVSQTSLLLQHFRDAGTDPLTGLLNRRTGVNLLALQWEQARRDHRPLSVALIDLDRFKRINDAHGHKAGDRALIDFVERLRAALRAGDALIRWGGEEFVAVLPGAAVHDTVRRLERVLHEHPLTGPDGAPLTFSAGVAELEQDAPRTPEALVALADRRMYQAKAA
ncbi:MAG TPA: diguanylate cyclase, partial [Candidatus Acetothermia bacterium]|nr:diguanylate cyclase [Candidatus Acetothermia bacterium]